MENTKWSKNVLLIDAEYADTVASNLRKTFSEMIGREIPKADISQWLVCMALDGGISQGDNEIQVIIVHDKEKRNLINFVPSSFKDELDGKAFRHPSLGEFVISSVQVENLVEHGEYFSQALEALADAKEIEKLIVVPDMDKCGFRLHSILEKTDGKEVTVLSMEPVKSESFKTDILGYSLMNALGIKGNEL